MFSCPPPLCVCVFMQQLEEAVSDEEKADDYDEESGELVGVV